MQRRHDIRLARNQLFNCLRQSQICRHECRSIILNHQSAGLTQGRMYSQQSPVQKKMWGPSTGAIDPIFPGKKLGTFFAHHSRFNRGSPIFSACKNFPFLLWGPLFVGAPSCSAEHAEHA